MTTYRILYNPLANNGKGLQTSEALRAMFPDDDLHFEDLTAIGDYASYFADLSAGDVVILCGGDGTLNRFINDTEGLTLNREILYFAAGSGNDFRHDVCGADEENKPFSLAKYIRDLPTVTVKDKTYRFLNGIGYGIDGYCCEVGDAIRQNTPDKAINYAGIAIKGLLFHYKPTNAKVTVDGETRTYKKVWLAPTMNGRYYGGGMEIAPAQDRLGDGTLSVVVMYGSGKLKTLVVFPSIFKGEHVSHKEMIDIRCGREITVEFDRPDALQIDGETILGVTSYTARAGK